MAELGYGSGNEAGLPQVDLPSAGGAPPIAPPQEPLKLVIPNTNKTSFWDSLPDDVQQSPNASTQAASNASPQPKTSAFWDSLPDAPLPPPSPPTLAEDMGQTLAKDTLPMAAVGRLNWPSDLANLAYHGGQYIGNKLRGQPLEGEQYNQMMSQSPLFGSSDIVQRAEHAAGIQPYDPYYNSTKLANTVASTVLGRKPIGAPAISLPQALSVGAGAGVAQLVAPDSALAPLVGGAAAAFAHEPIAAGAIAVKNAADNAGIGPKTIALSPIVSATKGQAQQAAQNVLGNATNPNNLQNSLRKPPTLVSGSSPTMAELSTDHGIAQYQDALRTQNPADFQQRAQEQNTARAQALTKVRGEGNPQTIGEFFTDRLQAEDAAAAAKEQAAQDVAQNKGASLTNYGELPSKGATSDMMQNAQAVRKETEDSAWDILNTYGRSSADGQPVIKAAHRLKYNINELGGEEHAPVETKLYDKIEEKWPKNNITISTLKTMRTSIGDAQREVKPGTQAYRRLSILKEAVDEAMQNTANGIFQHENQAVESGRMLESNTLVHKVREWYNKENAGANEATARGASGNNLQGRAAQRSGQAAFTRAFGTGKQAERGSDGASRSEGVPPAFGKEAKEQIESARRITFKNKTLIELQNSGIIKPDGTIDPNKYDRWYAKNRDRLKSNPQFQKDLEDWKVAQKLVNDLHAEREEKQAAFQKSRAAKFMDGRDPIAEIANIFGKKSTSRKEFADLINKVKGDKAALAGTKTAVGEYILQKFKVDLEDTLDAGGRPGKIGKIGQQDALRHFIKNNSEALREIYTPEELSDLEGVVADIKRTQQWNERAKIGGQSNTTKDALQVARQGKLSIFGRIAQQMAQHATLIGAGIGELAGGHPVIGGIAAFPVKMINAFQSKGLNTIKAIELQMVLHPSTFGKAMLQQIEAKEIPAPVQRRIAATLLKSIPEEGIVSSEHYHRKKSNE